jgi:ADP-dependent NAD(P)H-hydrate dehydratase / NAD(P)H-hydrate epimerase
VSNPLSLIAPPVAEANKYSRGAVGLAVGSEAYPGAALLAVRGALGVAPGYLRYLGPAAVESLVLNAQPEVVIADVAVDAWVVGSGFSSEPECRTRLEVVIAKRQPLVLDALALDITDFDSLLSPAVITPHLGEATRLAERLGVPAGLPAAELALTLATRTQTLCLLKGNESFIADPTGSLLAITGLSSWLATAGTGDVLAGVIGGLLARLARENPTFGWLELAQLVELAVLVHSDAAEMAAAEGRFGASAVAEKIGAAAIKFRLTGEARLRAPKE